MYFITFQSDCTNDFSYRDFIEASNQVTNNQNIELTRCFFCMFLKEIFYAYQDFILCKIQ